MNTLKRSLLFLNRNKGKSILIFVLLFCLAFSLIISFSIFYSCSVEMQNIIEDKADSFDCVYSIVDRSSALSNSHDTFSIVMSNTGLTTFDIQNDIIKWPGVATYNTYKKVFMDTTLNLYGDTTGKNSNAYFYAVNETKLHDFFRNGAFELISGRHIEREDENVCVISEDLADLNNLKVGDHVYPECTEDMIKSDGDLNKTIVDDYPMEIIGIYKMNFDYAAPEDSFIYELPQNVIFADHVSTKLWTVEFAKNNNEAYLNNIDEFDKATFFIDNSKPLADVIAPYVSIPFYGIGKNDSIYHGTVNAINSVNAPAVFIVLSVSAAILVLMFIFLSKSGKSRKKEDSLLIRSGISKKQVFAQRFLETGIIALIAFVIALVLVSLLITPISDGIKAADAARVFEPYTYEYIRADIQFGPQITQNGYLPDDFEITMNSAAIVWGIVIVFAVTVISALISASSVLKKKTLDIVFAKENECT